MAYLLGLNGKRQGRDLQLDRDLMHFGRSEANDYILEDPSVSGRHCTITRYDDGYILRDLESSNGTRVNDHEVKESKVEAGDIIEMGSLLFRFLEKDIGSAGRSPQIADAGDPFAGDEAASEPLADAPKPQPPPAPEPPVAEPKKAESQKTSPAPPVKAAPETMHAQDHMDSQHAPSSVALPSGRMPLDLTRRSMNYTFFAVGGVILLIIAIVVYLNLVLT